MKEMKFLYKTTIQQQFDEVDTQTSSENGSVIETKKTVKKSRPIKVAIQKPDRKLFKGAELFYAKTLSEYLKAGLLPYSLVAKRYANDGGPLSEKEKDKLKTLRDESRKLEAEFYSVEGNDTEKQRKKNELLIRINEINAEVSTIQNSYSDIFDSTAEVKTRNDTMEWWSLFLILIDEDGKGYKSIFGDGNYEERISKLEDYEDKNIPFFIEVIKRMSYLISFWFTARESVTSIDFKTMEALYVQTMSDYKIETNEELKISDNTAISTNSTTVPLSTSTVVTDTNAINNLPIA